MSEQPQSQRHRVEQDAPFHEEPSRPAAEHVAQRYEVQRVTTYVDYESEGTFASYAEAKAYADELLANDSGFGAGVVFEVLEDRGATQDVIYEAGA